jgi:glycosyltransferase involved in cell wall biosynthesis
VTGRALAINGKFLTGADTAVHKVALELVRALCDREGDLQVLVPPGLEAAPRRQDLPLERAGRLNGIAWEQISLPRARGGRLLLNLCNMTPLLACDAYTMVHDAQVFTAPASYGRARRLWARLHIRCAGRLQRGLLTVSDFSKRDLVAQGVAPPERIHVVHNGLDHILAVPPDDAVLGALGLAPRRYALALANPQAHKNIGLLLRAFARPDMADLTLVLAGSGTAADFAAQGHPVPPNVVFSGFVGAGEMRSLQAQALATCSPSLTEGFGLLPAEGMLLGTPAVIAPLGGQLEICGPAALHADARDAGAWAAALLRLRDDPDLWADLSRRGRARAGRFTWAAAADRLRRIVLGQTPRPATPAPAPAASQTRG